MGKEIISEERVDESSSDIRDTKILILLGDVIRDREIIIVAESIASKVGGMVSAPGPWWRRAGCPACARWGISGRAVAPDPYIGVRHPGYDAAPRQDDLCKENHHREQ